MQKSFYLGETPEYLKDYTRTPKQFNVRGARWQFIKKSTLGDDKVTIARIPTRSLMRKGYMSGAIDVSKTEVPQKYIPLI